LGDYVLTYIPESGHLLIGGPIMHAMTESFKGVSVFLAGVEFHRSFAALHPASQGDIEEELPSN